jgi:hypothetical protein
MKSRIVAKNRRRGLQIASASKAIDTMQGREISSNGWKSVWHRICEGELNPDSPATKQSNHENEKHHHPDLRFRHAACDPVM